MWCRAASCWPDCYSGLHTSAWGLGCAPVRGLQACVTFDACRRQVPELQAGLHTHCTHAWRQVIKGRVGVLHL